VSRARASIALRTLTASVRFGFREWRTVAVLLGVNGIVALLIVAPLLPALIAAFGHAPRSAGRRLLSPELLLGLGPVLEHARPSLLAPLLLLVLVQTLVAGGVVWRACDAGPFRLGAFLGQSGRLVGRNARLYLWLLPALILALLLTGLLAALMRALGLPTVFTVVGDAWLFGRPFTGWSVLHLALGALLLSCWRLALDSGRVLLFREDVRATRRVAWRAMRLALGSPGWLLLYAALGGLATLAVLAAAWLRAMLPEGNTGLALLALLAAQAVVWVRLSFQVAGVRLSAALVERRTAAPVPLAGPAEPGPGGEGGPRAALAQPPG